MGETVPELLPAFEQSFLGRLHLRFQYIDAKGVTTRCHAEPQAMLILPPLWYLVAWDPMREELRQFWMDRISQPKVLDGQSFRPRHVAFDDGVEPIRYA